MTTGLLLEATHSMPSDRKVSPSPPAFEFWAPRYWHTWLGLGTMWLIFLLPRKAQFVVGRALGSLVRQLPFAYVRIARSNIRLCFPELDESARQDLLRRQFHNIGIAVCETANTWWASDRSIAAVTEVVGREHIATALGRGRGAIMVGAHFTTIEIATRILGSLAPLNVLYRPTKNKLLSRFLLNNTARHARRAIPYDAIRTLVSALRTNEVVWYAPDQSYRNKGAALVPFFGIPAASTTATSRLAKMTGAAVLTYLPERLADGTYRVTISAPLEDYPGPDPVADVARFHAIIEAHIRSIPEQYLWIHRRFKGLDADYPNYYGRDMRKRAPTPATTPAAPT
jgi:Kdo2-lipid IVA lauroyltransferase/acyltransferase